jgi:hypothetical protein
MTINTAYKFYSDPGHGWMAVSFKNFFAVGAKLEDVSNFSYARGKTLYLEEDCDAGVFIKAFQKYMNSAPVFFEKFNERTPIRSYEPLYYKNTRDRIIAGEAI